MVCAKAGMQSGEVEYMHNFMLLHVAWMDCRAKGKAPRSGGVE